MAPTTVIKAFPTVKVSEKINTMQDVASQKPFLIQKINSVLTEVSIFSQQSSQLMTLMRTMPYFLKEIKMGKTENFKRELFLVVCLNIVIKQETNQEKNSFNCGF